MAKKYRFEVDADTKTAKDDLGKVGAELDDISAKSGKAGGNITAIGKSLPGVSKSFKMVGMSIKSAFAGLGVIALFFDMFRNNQKIMNIFNTALTSVQYVFNDIMDLLQPLLDNILMLFTDPVEAIKNLGKMVKDWVINYFQQAWDIIKNVGGAIANLVTGDWEGLKKNLKEIGTSFGDAILGSEGATERMIDNIVTAVKEGNALVNLLNKVKIAEAELEKLREKGDLRLEKQRQIRDDEARTIQERMAANVELGKILDEQILAELKIQKMKTEAARQEAIKSGLVEDQAEYIRQQAAEISILNRLEGQRSEQLTNTNTLLREQRDIQKSINDTEASLADIRDQQATIEMANALDKLNYELSAIDRKKQAQVQAINDELKLVTAGTAAYQELLNQKALIEEQANLDRAVKNQEIFNEEIKQVQDIAQAKIDADKQVDDYNKKLSEDKKKRDQDVAAAQFASADAVFGALTSIAGENAQAQKGISIAEAIMNTYKGATMALGSAPPPYSFIMMAAVIAAGIANVLKIARTKIPGKGGGGDTGGISSGGAGGAGGSRQPGTFSMVQPLQAQLANSLAVATDTKPNRAYVVQGDIESSAELDRSIKANARM